MGFGGPRGPTHFPGGERRVLFADSISGDSCSKEEASPETRVGGWMEVPVAWSSGS